MQMLMWIPTTSYFFYYSLYKKEQKATVFLRTYYFFINLECKEPKLVLTPFNVSEPEMVTLQPNYVFAFRILSFQFDGLFNGK